MSDQGDGTDACLSEVLESTGTFVIAKADSHMPEQQTDPPRRSFGFSSGRHLSSGAKVYGILLQFGEAKRFHYRC